MTIFSSLPLMRRTLSMPIPVNMTRGHFTNHLPPKVAPTPCDLKDRVIALEKIVKDQSNEIKSLRKSSLISDENLGFEATRLRRSLLVTDIAVFAIFIFSL